MPVRRKARADAPPDFERAAITALKKNARPLATREIVEQMIRLGLATPSGKTPQNSMQNTIKRANLRSKAETYEFSLRGELGVAEHIGSSTGPQRRFWSLGLKSSPPGHAEISSPPHSDFSLPRCGIPARFA